MKRRFQAKPARPQTVGFEIEHMDPLGQGVSKTGGVVTFISGTLPGECGTAVVYKRARGVQFARLQRLDKAADNRQQPECPHFEHCPGCQYLHTGYDSELDYKMATLNRYLAPLNVPPEVIEVVPAPRRLAYRNRVQLHYRHRYIGMLDSVKNEVLEVPQCRIFRPEMQAAFDQLYRRDWTREHSGHGHCELYFRSGEVSVRWDEAYAHGGFSQVYDEMNQVLKERVDALLKAWNTSSLLDLFSGAGNLSDNYHAGGGSRILIDSYIDPAVARPDHFYPMDLYEEQTLVNFMRRTAGTTFDTLLLDPPRRGFPGLAGWVKKIKPRQLCYVSCNPASLARDLQNLQGRYRFRSVQLLDLFPATAHFETLVALEMRNPGG